MQPVRGFSLAPLALPLAAAALLAACDLTEPGTTLERAALHGQPVALAGWTPDAPLWIGPSTLAFIVTRNGQRNSVGTLDAATGARAVWSAAPYDLRMLLRSPDPNELLAIGADAANAPLQLLRLPLDGSPPTHVTDLGGFASLTLAVSSPDGRRVAVQPAAEAATAVYDLDTGVWTAVLPSQPRLRPYAFSLDGAELVLSAGGTFCAYQVVTLATGTARPLNTGEGCIDEFRFESADHVWGLRADIGILSPSVIAEHDALRGTQRELFRPRDSGAIVNAAWSPDRRTVAFQTIACAFDCHGPPGFSGVYLLDPATGAVRQVAGDNLEAYPGGVLLVSPDGGWLAYRLNGWEVRLAR